MTNPLDVFEFSNSPEWLKLGKEDMTARIFHHPSQRLFNLDLLDFGVAIITTGDAWSTVVGSFNFKNMCSLDVLFKTNELIEKWVQDGS